MHPALRKVARPTMLGRLLTALLLLAAAPLLSRGAEPAPPPNVPTAAPDVSSPDEPEESTSEEPEPSTEEEPAEPDTASETSETEPTADSDADEEEVALEPEPGEFRNWFDVSVGGLIVSGDKAAAQARRSLPATAFGGVSELHYEHDVGKRGLLRLDGRGIFDNEDYGIRLEYMDSEKGFVRAGFEQFRDYHDGSGGWFPRQNLWFDLYDDRFELLRGSAFFEAGLRMPNIPEITIRYEHAYRDGFKDATTWGTTTTDAGLRAIVPAFWRIDENIDRVSLDVRHTIANTTFGAAFTYEHSDLDNSRYLRRQPFEPSDRRTTQTESVETDLYSARAFVDTTFSPKLRLTTAYLFTTLDTDFSGSRINGPEYDAIYDPIYGRGDLSFINLAGGSQLDQHVWNVNLMWTPLPRLVVIPALRIENQTVHGTSSWLDTAVTDVAREAANSRDRLDLAQQLEIRYTGFTNIVLYARGDWVQGDGSLFKTQSRLDIPETELRRDTDFDRFSQKYTAGIHWYPLRRLNLHAQYYRKMRESEYDDNPATYVNLSGAYPGFLEAQNFATDDFNIRLTWRPLERLTLVTRYDFQYSIIDSRAEGLDEIRSGTGTAHIIGETITWTPTDRLYLQPGFNYILDTTRSHAASPTAPVEDANNDYFTVSLTAGLVIDNRTDLQLHYNYYLASNFNDISSVSQPYGADTEEHGVLASIIRRINKKLSVTVRYGFFTSRDSLAGGFNDFDAHLVFASARYLF